MSEHQDRPEDRDQPEHRDQPKHRDQPEHRDQPDKERSHDDRENQGQSSTGGSSGPQDPLAQLFAQLGLNPAGGAAGAQQMDLNALMQQFSQLFGQLPGAPQPQSGGIGFQAPGAARPGQSDEWAWLKNMVRQMSASLGPDPSPTAAQRRQLGESVRLAEMWLDEAVEFPAVQATPAVWSRADWIEQTFGSWRPLAEPVIKALAASLGQAPEEGGDAQDPMAMLGSMLAPMMENLARQMYGAQFAQALAELSTSVVSSSDVGLQLAAPRVALVADNIQKHFGELDLPETDVWLYLSLREAARQRLFAHAAWLGPHLQALVEHYARETRIDLRALQDSIDVENMGGLDPARLQEMSEQLQGKLFDPEPTPEQAEILDRLQTLLALVEGWVDHVVTQAAGRWMPTAPALAEAVRRRRGAAGASDDVLRTLVGLQLKPRRVRDAENLWAAVLDKRGAADRDALWAHPDLLPAAADLDDPLGFADPEARPQAEADEWDKGLEQLLREEGRTED